MGVASSILKGWRQARADLCQPSPRRVRGSKAPSDGNLLPCVCASVHRLFAAHRLFAPVCQAGRESSPVLGYTESMKKAEKIRGFTIIELMVTLVVAAILLGVGVPSFIGMMKNNRLATAANNLAGSISLARGEAVTRGQRVKVCKSADGSNCTANDDWEQGWVVMVDQNNDGTPDDIDGDGNAGPTLRVVGALAGDVSMVGVTNSDDNMSFIGNGRSASGVIQTVTLCDDRSGDFGWRLVLGPDGRLSVLGYESATKVTCP